jgi:hypothetical protein
MKKHLLLIIIIFLSIGAVYSQVQVKKPLKQKIQPLQTLKVLSPNGGEKWEIGREYIIRWETRGNIKSVKIMLENAGKLIMLTGSIGTTNDGAHQWTPRWNNPPPGHYKLQLMSLDGAVKDISDGSFEVIPPPVDLKCVIVYQVKKAGRGMKKKYWNYTISIHNKGTKKLENVLFNWVITKNNVVVKQDGAGFGLMYPNKLYEAKFVQTVSKGKWRLEVFVDPDNRQNEVERLRSDNNVSTEIEIK